MGENPAHDRYYRTPTIQLLDRSDTIIHATEWLFGVVALDMAITNAKMIHGGVRLAFPICSASLGSRSVADGFTIEVYPREVLIAEGREESLRHTDDADHAHGDN